MKITRHIPNTITSLNVLCGVLGVIAAFGRNYDIAFYFMLAGAVCDFCDGFAARLLKAYSPMGKELDSLADLITFGLLPSVMLYQTMQEYHPGQWFSYVPLIIVVFSALRLAKFNVDERQSENFIGLATPACAMLCGSFATICKIDILNIAGPVTQSVWIIPAASVLLSILLVSEIPMFSMKFKKGTETGLKVRRITFLILSALSLIITFILGRHIVYAIFIIFTLYIVMNLIHKVITK
ncbi:MAG: CDP-diacylglycerol--serine O-phosphatidyltransferase [Bacteroidales bacterium]|nr:CDP-diacylglycerol--serine O-phosphatidyltransferase [Bacteroidales bacterium]